MCYGFKQAFITLQGERFPAEAARTPGVCVIITRELVSTHTASWRVRQITLVEC